MPCEPVSLERRPTPRARMFARGLSIRAPASGSRDFRTLPAVHILRPPAAVSAHLRTDLSSLPRPRPQESGAAFVAARVASRSAPYPEHDSPASHGIQPSVLLPAFSNLLPVVLAQS